MKMPYHYRVMLSTMPSARLSTPNARACCLALAGKQDTKRESASAKQWYIRTAAHILSMMILMPTVAPAVNFVQRPPLHFSIAEDLGYSVSFTPFHFRRVISSEYHHYVDRGNVTRNCRRRISVTPLASRFSSFHSNRSHFYFF